MLYHNYTHSSGTPTHPSGTSAHLSGTLPTHPSGTPTHLSGTPTLSRYCKASSLPMTCNIPVFQISPGTILEELLESKTRHYLFTMCNPPFFKSQKDKLGQKNSRSDGRPVPSTCNTGTVTETITEGGELRFVKDIVRDSLKYKNRVQ